MSDAIRRAERVEARLAPYRWRWAEANRDLIAAHWRARTAERPALFNGRVLMVSAIRQDGGTIRARFFETDYADLLAWIEHGFPGEPVWNGFAMGALRGRDGAFVLGRMGAHTANAGRLYFPCGTPDRSDLTPDGRVDLAASLTREIEEETGLGPGDYEVDPDWAVVEHRGLLGFMRTVRLRTGASEACRRIRAFIAAEAQPELGGVEIVAGPQDLDEGAMPGIVPIFLRDAFAASQVG